MPFSIIEGIVQLSDDQGNLITSTSGSGGVQALDVNVVGEVISSPLSNSVTSGTISAVNGYVQIATESYQSRAIQISGTWDAELIVEFSIDNGVTWNQTNMSDGIGDSVEGIVIPLIYKTIKTNGLYKPIAASALTHLRVRAQSYTSGVINVYINQSMTTKDLVLSQSEIIQGVIILQKNSYSSNLTARQLWIGTGENTLGFNSVQVSIMSSSDMEVFVQQSPDNVNWDIEDKYFVERNIGHGRTFKIVHAYVRVSVRNLFSNITSFFRLVSKLVPMSEPLPRQLTSEGNLKVAIAENCPTIKEGTILKYSTDDIEVRQLLKDMLIELKKITVHLSVMTDEKITNLDVLDIN